LQAKSILSSICNKTVWTVIEASTVIIYSRHFSLRIGSIKREIVVIREVKFVISKGEGKAALAQSMKANVGEEI
jgi:hypothetical protein